MSGFSSSSVTLAARCSSKPRQHLTSLTTTHHPLQSRAFVANYLLVMFVHGQLAMPQAVLFTLKQFHVVLVALKPLA
jgi:hypothetical protein